MIVANPIYDIVFKYLMEDERIARTILSALLKKDVIEVHTRRNEYTDQQRDNLSIFRIDFGATIRNVDGTEQLILIEVQKTWVETETLRFRQYLGAQYASKGNIVGHGRQEHALPMVAVYLLGHKVGDIEEPVIYVNHSVCDYYEQPVEKGIPDPFVDSLTHNSIIVQIPRLHGRINNKLDKVLSIFDQTHADRNNMQTLNIDEEVYAGDADMQPIIHRLVSAAADTEMRHKMNVEDEFFSVLERRETELMMMDKQLAETKVVLKEKSAALEETKVVLEEKSAALEEKSAALEEKSAALEEKSAALEETKVVLEEKSAALEEAEDALRKSIKALLKFNLPPEAIASTLGISMEDVQRLAD
ncbi:MAG: hypothetical protein II864_06190 [Prevotella sp.]|nr:hypothetical protein [Prevotella sp.]